MRSSRLPGAGRDGARFYIWFFRGTPLLIQLVMIYSGLPQIGIKFGVLPSVIIALVSNEAAYMAEIIRSGFLAIPPGQRMMQPMALGLSRDAAYYAWCYCRKWCGSFCRPWAIP